MISEYTEETKDRKGTISTPDRHFSQTPELPFCRHTSYVHKSLFYSYSSASSNLFENYPSASRYETSVGITIHPQTSVPYQIDSNLSLSDNISQ